MGTDFVLDELEQALFDRQPWRQLRQRAGQDDQWAVQGRIDPPLCTLETTEALGLATLESTN